MKKNKLEMVYRELKVDGEYICDIKDVVKYLLDNDIELLKDTIRKYKASFRARKDKALDGAK